MPPTQAPTSDEEQVAECFVDRYRQLCMSGLSVFAVSKSLTGTLG